MARDYSRLFTIAEKLQEYDRYLDTAGEKRQAGIETSFVRARRRFVSRIFREGSDQAAIIPSVLADLQRAEIIDGRSEWAIALLRNELVSAIHDRINTPLLTRIARYVGPALLAIAVAAVYLYLRIKANG